MAEETHSGLIHSLESFASSDGPGVRFAVFMQGCNLRCAYCHNPDTWAAPEKATVMTPQEVLERALRCREYWGETGGVTVSGGEPLLQTGFLRDFFALCKEHGVNTCLDTSGEPFSRTEPQFSQISSVIALTDLVLLDIKHIDESAHRDLTGKGNGAVLDFAKYLSAAAVPVWIRYVLVPGINDSAETLKRTVAFLKTLSNIRRVDVLPYHTLGVFKYKALGLPYRLEGVRTPDPDEAAAARAVLEEGISK